MIKSGEGSREYEIKNGNTTVRKVGEDIELEGRNVAEPCAYVEAEMKKMFPVQPFWTIHARAAVRLPCNANMKDISAAFEVAWGIVQEESEIGLKKGQEELNKLLQNQQVAPTTPQSSEQKETAKTPDDVFINWEVE